MGGGQGQTRLGQIAKEVLDHQDMEKRLREEQAKREKEKQQRLIWAYYFIQYIAKDAEECYRKYENAFNRVHLGALPLPSRNAFKQFANETFKLAKVMEFMDNFDKTYHLDHTKIQGIDFIQNRKTVMTA